jgi:hypothetical protein
MLLRALLCSALAAALLLSLAGAAQAQARDPIIGIGEQKPGFFADQHFTALGLRDVRVIASWDALNSRSERAELDAYMAQAEEAGARVLLGFGHSRMRGRTRVLPSPARFRHEFLRFRARYPLVRDYLTWNEANHCGQPTCHRPERAARYFDVIAANCTGCRIVAADVLDSSRLAAWVSRFLRAARHRPRIWGLHNYIDANRFYTRGTRSLLRTVRGEVWFTETGGLVERRNNSRILFPGSTSHQARAMRFVFRLARLSPRRIRRIYVYHWNPAGPDATWDSALIGPDGVPRPAYDVLRSWIQRSVARRAAG